jgi:guanylate kinase
MSILSKRSTAEAAKPLVIISGPSGAGKSTVVETLLSTCPLPIVRSTSVTTRPPRPGEIDGQDYHFVTPERFEDLRRGGAFLECKEVFGRGDWYGTLRETVASGRQRGNWVLLEIDVEGAMAVLESEPDCLTIFLHPGSMAELERRLRARRTETDEAIARRLAVAAREMGFRPRYQFEVINHEVPQAAREICELLQREERRRCSKS